jgi:hypothetical protein
VLDKQPRFFANSSSLTDLNQAEVLHPARFFASSGPAIPKKQLSGEKKGRIDEFNDSE